MPSKKIVITGGGTGGHVFPALAIAEELRDRGYEILYVGSGRGMEAKLAPEKGFAFYEVRTGSVKNQGVLKIAKTLWMLIGGLLWSLRFLLRERPKAVIGVGGYVSVPACVAAFVLRIPVFLQEQNTSVGIANRFLGRLSKKIFLGFAQGQAYFSAKKCVVTGNPIRKEFFSSSLPPHNPEAKALVVMGGSQGAQAINRAIAELLPRLDTGISIFHQTGQSDLEMVRQAYAARFKGRYEVVPFVTDMPSFYAKGSMIVSRSGALTVSELIQMGRPAILVPYPRKGQNDQLTNARFLEEHGVGRVVEQGENFTDRFLETFEATFQPGVLRRMAGNFSQLRTARALASIGDQIEQFVGNAG